MNCLKNGTEYNEHIPLKLEDAQKGIQISVIKRHNPALLELSILSMLKDVTIFYDVTWQPEAELKVIDSIISIYWHLKIEELAYIFRNGIDGVYGQVYGKLSPATVLQWISGYDAERDAFYVDRNSSYKEGYDKQFRETEIKTAKRINELRKKALEQQQAYKDAKNVIEKQD